MAKNAMDVVKAIIFNYIKKQEENNIPKDQYEYPTQLKIQKLLYFAQAAFLSLLNKPAFKEEIEAWQYWPVVREVYNELKKFWNNPVKFDSADLKKAYSKFSDKEKDIISFINDTFWKYSASKLVEITHKHKPWKEAFERDETVISKSTLQKYYKPLFEFDLK